MMKRRNIPQQCPVDPLDLKHLQIPSDVLGSYTGRTEHRHEIPVQDADDL